MTPFAAIITPTSVSWSSLDGKVNSADRSHKKFAEICDLIKTVQAAIKNPAGQLVDADIINIRQALDGIVEMAKTIVSAGNGKVTVTGGVVFYNGNAVNNAITTRILWGLSEGFDMSSYINFLENCLENPSMRAVTEFYTFLERNSMGITDDGHALGYKRVTQEFQDIRTRTFDNSPGSIVEMPRNEVDDNCSVTCSAGLHFCSISYLSQYRSGTNDKVVIVKVNPRDIVSIPIDYDHQKVRCCRYEVVSEYTGSDLEDILKTKAVWRPRDLVNINDPVDDDADDADWDADWAVDSDAYDDDDFDPIFDEEIADDDDADKEPLISQETEDAVRNAFDYLASQIAGAPPKED